MGTRHFQKVITKEGEVKVRQYGQWDGYPSGQGVDILRYLRTGDLEKYQQELGKLREITEEEREVVDNDLNWETNYPYMSRDCGSRVHKMIEDGLVKFVAHCDDQEANKWCEGFYTIDFQNGVFVSEYRGRLVSYDIDKLPTDEDYIESFTNNDEE